ncbi:hypothetical protein SDC9_65411 [bioreactor metagenome]|uniref:Uncharacterized protein n=1 Tax=bioreactor metagenome TaxID=1076179 RepID=A0A644XXH4_9ZZZZ
MIDGTFGFEFPFVHCPAAALRSHPILCRQVFGQQLVDTGDAPVKRQCPLVAKRYGKPGVDETFPEVRIVNHVPDRPLPGDIRHHPVEAEPIARLFPVLGHRFR